jgi:hypothetical protein
MVFDGVSKKLHRSPDSRISYNGKTVWFPVTQSQILLEVFMPKKPTTADAELIIKLYDLRREAELRKARNWWLVNFWPESADDFMKIGGALGTQENNWLRQVAGYWSMVASLTLAGTVNQELVLDPSFSGEMFFIFAKVKPFLGELRTKMKNPRMFANVEKVINSSKQGREWLKYVEGQVAGRREAMAKMAKAS